MTRRAASDSYYPLALDINAVDRVAAVSFAILDMYPDIVAPVGTACLTVTDETGRTREPEITPWNGAYVAIVARTHRTLTG